jgi:hypothetical protein
MGWEDASLTTIQFCALRFPTGSSERRSLFAIADDHLVPSEEQALLGQAFDGVTLFRNYRFFGPSIDNSEVAIDVTAKEIQRTGLTGGLSARAYMARYLQAWVDVKQAIVREGWSPQLDLAINRIGERDYGRPGLSYRLSALAVPVFGFGSRISNLRRRMKDVRQGILTTHANMPD